eukprot:GEMP01010614.1.p1 GENE.GEMP01010614.1~~GEMP01010614.1.p1  ORF type:complete len:299 (+),score=74.79 GEMP01010614.1:128-1024(+)
MAAFTKILGSNLLTKDGSLKLTADLLEGKAAVAVYFSEQWCPPCQKFTPELVEKYNTIYKEGKNMEVVFVSCDDTEAELTEYYAKQPWLALPFAQRDVREKLLELCDVTGFPTLAIFDPHAKIVTLDGRSKINDSEGFPWSAPNIIDQLLVGPFIGPNGTTVTHDAIAGKQLGLYFSAHWCPPCKKFTPMLAETYKKLKKDKPNFEIVFVSSDRDEQQFKEYFGQMPWIALPFSERSLKDKLSSHFNVQGIPTLAIVDADHKTVINSNARSAVQGDPEGKSFPWNADSDATNQCCRII